MALSSAITTDDARVDIQATGFWGDRRQRAFFDVKVFNPFAKSFRDIPLMKCYKRCEQQKKRAYEERIREVEHGSFTPLIFSAQGGMSKETATMYKRLASLLSSKRSQPYSSTINWIRCRIGFALLRSMITCLRGARSSHLHFIRNCTVQYCTTLYCTVLYCTLLYFTVLYCTALYSTVLHCTVLYCTVLYCTILYHTVLYCTILYFTVLYCTLLYCTVQYCTTLYCTVLYYTVLYCTLLYFTVLYCTTLYCTVLYCTLLYFTVLYCTLLYCTVQYCTRLYCTVLYCTLLYFTVLHCTALYSTVLHCTVLYCTTLYCTANCLCVRLYCTVKKLSLEGVRVLGIVTMASVEFCMKKQHEIYTLAHLPTCAHMYVHTYTCSSHICIQIVLNAHTHMYRCCLAVCSDGIAVNG